MFFNICLSYGCLSFALVLTSLNSLKTKVNDLDVGKLKTVPIDLKKLSYVVNNEGVKNSNSTY